MPFFRAHAHIDTKYREPWTFSKELFSQIKDVIQLRYQLLPYLFNEFKLHRETGQPVLSPMWYKFSADPKCLSIEDQFMFGGSILVKALTDEKDDQVYLPIGDGTDSWVNLQSITEQLIE